MDEANEKRRRQNIENRLSSDEISRELAQSKTLNDPRTLKQRTLFGELVSSTRTAATTTTTGPGSEEPSQQAKAGMARADKINSKCPYCWCFDPGYGRRRSHLVKPLDPKHAPFFGCAKYGQKNRKTGEPLKPCQFRQTASKAQVDADEARLQANRELKKGHR